MWLNNGLPEDLCGPSAELSPQPRLWQYGFYRKLESGKYELVPFCMNKSSQKMIGIVDYQFNYFLDTLLPERPEN